MKGVTKVKKNESAEGNFVYDAQVVNGRRIKPQSIFKQVMSVVK